MVGEFFIFIMFLKLFILCSNDYIFNILRTLDPFRLFAMPNVIFSDLVYSFEAYLIIVG